MSDVPIAENLARRRVNTFDVWIYNTGETKGPPFYRERAVTLVRLRFLATTLRVGQYIVSTPSETIRPLDGEEG